MRASDAALIAAGWSDARSFLEGAGKAAHDVERMEKMLSTGLERRDGTGPRPVYSDPTASAAAWAEHEKRAEAALEAKRQNAIEIVEAASTLLSGVGAGLGEGFAAVVDAHYLQNLPWGDAAESVGVSKMTAIRRASVAFEWIDSVGWLNAARGRGRAV